MAIDYKRLMATPPRETIQSFSVRDTILYALGVGVGCDPALEHETLRYAYEENLEALPSMAVILAYPGFWLKEPQFGADWKRVLHAEETVTLHRPLPVAGEAIGILTIEEIYDKGPDKGAIVHSKREIYDRATGDHLATDARASFLRGDGGCGGRTDPAPAPPRLPDRPPELSIALPTQAQQALIYRLSGDYNPLHADPAVASAAGFGRPILHGLCTYGVVTRALMLAVADEGKMFSSMTARFSAPVYPGDTIETEIWPEGNTLFFRALAKERGAVVLNNGRAEFK